MPKRKREDADNNPIKSTKSLSSTRPDRRKELCAQRIAAAQKPLVSALRHAAGLERQKFSRRKKDAKSTNNEKASQRLEIEYAKLKQLDLPKLAEQHLRRTIAKVKSLKDNEYIPERERVVEKGEQDAALLNVQARLFKVDAVRTVVDEVIDDLKEIVGAGATGGEKHAGADVANKKKAKVAEEEDDPSLSNGDFDSDVLVALNARIAAPSSADEDSEDSLSEGLRPPSVRESESEDDDELDWEADMGSGEEASHALTNGGSLAEDSSSPGALHDSCSEAESESDLGSQVDEGSRSLPTTKRKVAPVEKPSKSTFLPSLSHAAYYSGSESEASDLDADLASKKNRRGQRARQKIWEQKYGAQAKHKQKEDRAQGWDAKRGAVTGDKRGGHGRGNGPPRGYGPVKSGENAIPVGKKKVTKRDDVGDLHPSWQAAKATKEKKSGLKIDLSAKSSKKVIFD